jgi:hypothetical protein
MTVKRHDAQDSGVRASEHSSPGTGRGGGGRMLLLYSLLLLCLLGALFVRSFLPGYVVFSNDGPLGAVVAEQNRMPAILTGMWMDLNSVGGEYPAPSPTLFSALRLVTNPWLFSKIFPAAALFILGVCAWFCFRQWGLTPLACILGGLAAVLNSAYFSVATWGVAAQTITVGMVFLALGLLADTDARRRWIRTVLAGMAVGLGIMEGYDMGAIYSLFVAGFVAYSAALGGGSPAAKVSRAVSRLTVVALAAAFIATHAVVGLIGTQIKGVAGADPDSRTKQERWDWATQWSLPKRETLGLFIPGVFGYRMDTPDGGAYWGAVGRDPAWDRYFEAGRSGPAPAGSLRFSGGGAYAGVIVLLVSFWATFQAFRYKDSVFAADQRKWIWFFAAAVILSLLLAYGRHAPFYQFLYALPYFSTIRNPAKFLNILSIAVVILFAYGIHGLSRRYLEAPLTAAADWKSRLKSWWAKAPKFDRNWVAGCIVAIVAALLGWLIYASAQPSLVQYLQTIQFDEGMARAIASFSVKQVGWFILLLTLAVALVVLVMSGQFAGHRARWGGILLGTLLVGDLALANRPWIIYWDYKEKYASNPVIDYLREEPHERRVVILPRWMPMAFRVAPQAAGAQQFLEQLYGIEWAQHHFQYYNIQSLDIVQMPRMPVDLLAFENALQFRGTQDTLHLVTRRWELTNTRYILSATNFLEVLNKALDPGRERFRVATNDAGVPMKFDILAKPGVINATRLDQLTAALNPNGPYALVEFTGALPRVKLYANWQVSTNDQATLEQLANPEFDPAQTVLVAAPLPDANTPGDMNQNAGTVEFASYAPKHIVLDAKAEAPSILLLNDRHDPNWRVLVNGQPAPLLRANFIMRAVHLPAGTHKVEFVFKPDIRPLFVSLAAIALAVVLTGVLVISGRRNSPTEQERPMPGAKRESPARPARKEAT